MEDRYGDLWAARFGAFPRDRVMRTWAEDLADMTRGELARGVAACRDQRFPPTLAEFRALCRPPVDYHAALLEAVEQMARRESGGDRWSHPAIYWAAVQIGSYDLSRKSLREMEPDWRRALGEQLAKDGWPEIPARLSALPAPGQAHSRARGDAATAAISAAIAAERDPFGWARKPRSQTAMDAVVAGAKQGNRDLAEIFSGLVRDGVCDDRGVMSVA